MSGYESPFVRGSDAELCGFVWVVSGTEIDLPSDVRKTTYRTANPMHTHTHAHTHTHTHTHTHYRVPAEGVGIHLPYRVPQLWLANPEGL